MLVRTQRNWDPCSALVESKTVTDTVENSLTVPQKVKHTVTKTLSNSAPRYIFKGTENRGFHRYFYNDVHCSIFLAQRLKSVSTPQQMYKQNVVYTHTHTNIIQP